MSDPNWPRWIFASMSKHFSDAAVAANVPFYVEGDDRNIQAEASSYFEFRMNGPSLNEISKDWWLANIEINILVCAKRTDADFHKIHTLVGILTSAFTSSIKIFKYGTGIGDDQSVLDCLTLFAEESDDVRVQQLGQLDPNLLEAQASVEGDYRGFLVGD